ncbi:MAG: cell division protein FtsA [Patescibacteria group bacterium]
MAKSKLIAAIDIGSSKIVTLLGQIRPDNPDKVHVVGVSSIASRGIRKGQVVNIEEATSCISNSIESAERMAGFNLSSAYVSIDGSHISSQNSQGVVAVSEPHGEVGSDDVRRVLDAARAVSLPAATEIVHVIPRSFTVDGQDGIKDPIGMTGVRLEAGTHIVTGSSGAIKNLQKCLADVGCDVAGMVFGGLAGSYAVLTDTERELGVVLVDIGAGTTDIAVFGEGSLSHSAVLPVGAKNVTNDLAIGLRVSLESAEKIKIFLQNVSQKEKEDDVDISSLSLPEEIKSVSYRTLVDGIIRPRLNEIFQVIAVELKQSNLAGLTPSGLVITGGGSMTVGAIDSAKRVLSMPVRIGFPTGISGLIDEIESPAFATAVGLLIYGNQSHESAGVEVGWSNKFPLKDMALKIGDLLKSLLP